MGVLIKWKWVNDWIKLNQYTKKMQLISIKLFTKRWGEGVK